MVVVNFANAVEYIDELTADVESIDRKILRLTYRRQRTPHGTHHLTVVATCLVFEQIYQLTAYIGEDWGIVGNQQLNGESIRIAGQAVMDQLTTAAAGLGLAVRAGVLAAA